MLWCVLFSQSTHCCVMFVCAAPPRKDFHWTWRLRSPFFGFGFGVGLAWGHGLLLVSMVSKHSPHPRAKTLEDGWTLHVSLFVFSQPLDKQHGKSKISIWDDVSKSWFSQVFNQPSWQRTGPLSLSFSFLQVKLSDAQDEFKLSCWQGFVWRHCYEVSAHTANYTEE